MSQVTLPFPAANILDGLLEQTLFDVLAHIAAASTRRRRIRAAFVGNDPHLLLNLEAIFDSLIDFSDASEADIALDPVSDWRMTFNCFDGPAGDIYRPSRPMAELNTRHFDLIVVADAQPNREMQLTQQVHAKLEADPQPSPIVVAFSRLRNAFVAALLSLRPGAYFTTMNSRKTLTTLVSLYLALDAPGCVVECGTYMGGTSIFMGLLVQRMGEARPRRVHTFDTFEGIPSAVGVDGRTAFSGGQFTETSFGAVQQYIQAHGLGAAVFAHKGLIQDELPKLWDQEREVAFCFADTDQYSGTAATLTTVLPRLNAKGLVLVDDCFEHGVRKAIDEALAQFPQFAGAMVCHSMYLIWNR
jgi:hypothetical protein